MTATFHRIARYTVVLGLVLGAFAFDLSSGNEVSSSLFYIVPVALGAWLLGLSAGLAVATISTAAWLAAQALVGASFSKPSILYWNVVAEGAIYCATAWAIARVRAARDGERRLTAQVLHANQQLDREALAVGQLQRELLPHGLPEVPGYAWEIHYTTSAHAGGDYYDAFEQPGGRVSLFVADATGHGAPAAVLMGMAKALLTADGGAVESPERALGRLNRQLARVLPAGWFLTACHATLDPPSGALVYALAGHDAPLMVRAGGRIEQLAARGGPPLGPFPDQAFEGGAAVLAPGDTLLVFTDGATETMSPSGELFGIERLMRAVCGAEQLAPERAMERLLAALAAHRDGAAIADDTTIVMLRRSA